MSFTLTFLFPCFVFADTFPTGESYLAQLVGEHQVLQAKTATVKTSSGERIFGVACWELEAATPEDQRTAQASIFVLEGTSAGFRELAHSEPFEFVAMFQRFLELAIEASVKDKFRVTVLLQSSGIGFVQYRFIERRNTWYLAGLESSQSSSHLEEGDEAIGDSRSEQSTNFLTGSTVTKTFHANRLASEERKKKVFPRFPLEQFEIFDSRHDE